MSQLAFSLELSHLFEGCGNWSVHWIGDYLDSSCFCLCEGSAECMAKNLSLSLGIFGNLSAILWCHSTLLRCCHLMNERPFHSSTGKCIFLMIEGRLAAQGRRPKTGLIKVWHVTWQLDIIVSLYGTSNIPLCIGPFIKRAGELWMQIRNEWCVGSLQHCHLWDGITSSMRKSASKLATSRKP